MSKSRAGHRSNPGGQTRTKKHKSPSKIRRLERRAQARLAPTRPEPVLARLADPLEQRTLADLKAIAKEYGVKGYSKYKASDKQALCDAIRIAYITEGD